MCARPSDSYYDNGWNDFIAGKPMKYSLWMDYRDGYLDCKSANPEQRKPI